MGSYFFDRILSPKIRFEKIKNLSSLKQLKEEEGFTLVELIVVVMMIGILSSIAIPQFMTSADKAKQKEATGIVSALVKAATAYQTEYGVLPTNALQISEYAKFQECFADGVDTQGGAACRGQGETVVVRAVADDATDFYTTSGNYRVYFTHEGGSEEEPLFQVRAIPNGNPFSRNGSSVTGCYNPVMSVSEIYEFTAKTADKGPKPFKEC